MPELDPITGPEPSKLSPALLAERLASERALREQSLVYERELRHESREANKVLLQQLATAHSEVHVAESEARDKAEAAVDKRLEGMNEFRDQLRMQAATFVTISVFETWKEEARRSTDESNGLITDLHTTAPRSPARRSALARPQGMVVAAIVGAITIGSVIFGLVIGVVNLLTAA